MPVTAVVVLDGGLLMGDWWMERGDVLIAAPGVEYGMLLNGPQGCQLLEIFARDTLSRPGARDRLRPEAGCRRDAGGGGVHLLELARTAPALTR